MSTDIRTVDLTIALPLRKLGDERRAIEHKLTGLKSQYVPEVDGVLIKWSDLNILNDKGIIIDDQPYTFWKVSFTAQVFKPIEGKVVKGKIHRMLKNYFIAKALDTFIVTVNIPESLLANMTIQNLMVDQDVYFKIKGGTGLSYRGELDEECLDLTTQEAETEAERNVYGYAKDFEY